MGAAAAERALLAAQHVQQQLQGSEEGLSGGQFGGWVQGGRCGAHLF